MDQLNSQQSTTTTPEPKNKVPIIAGTIVAVAVLGTVGIFLSKNGEKNETPKGPSPSNQKLPTAIENEGSISDIEKIPENQETTNTPTLIQTGTSYKDGNYQADGAYQSPAGPEKVRLSITLKDGIVTDSALTATSEAPKSVFFQGKFIANYKSLVIGKKIDEIKLSVVSGSSLTPMGFNDALAKIAGEASR